ncbi:MAG TPA: histidine kinase dimerization/phosphoacceptor domain-containing protein, partial [Actinomycetes bacterium]|nr:histidine kinase dimerization/phosphoacceptor domain-containing protein [Actinomycetes bacterium]
TAAAGPTRSGCGWPGSSTTWSRTRSPCNFRAGVALHVLDRRPGEARAALEAILAGSAGAMQELRAALGVLR